METIGQRILKLRKSAKKTQGALGRAIGVSDVTVGYWEKDVNKPGRDGLKALAAFFGVSEAYILLGGEISDDIQVGFGVRRAPVISWVQAGSWTDTCDAVTLNDVTEWVPIDDSYSKLSFALKVKGDSMQRKDGGKTIPEGSIVVVDPEFDPSNLNGQVVVAVLEGSNEATVKEFREDGPAKYLVPWNERYDVIRINGSCRIVGCVKDVIIRLRK